jgi:hypothetical protein
LSVGFDPKIVPLLVAGQPLFPGSLLFHWQLTLATDN